MTESMTAGAHHHLRLVRKYRRDDVLNPDILRQMRAFKRNERRATGSHWACSNDALHWASKVFLMLLHGVAWSAVYYIPVLSSLYDLVPLDCELLIL